MDPGSTVGVQTMVSDTGCGDGDIVPWWIQTCPLSSDFWWPNGRFGSTFRHLKNLWKMKALNRCGKRDRIQIDILISGGFPSKPLVSFKISLAGSFLGRVLKHTAEPVVRFFSQDRNGTEIMYWFGKNMRYCMLKVAPSDLAFGLFICEWFRFMNFMNQCHWILLMLHLWYSCACRVSSIKELQQLDAKDATRPVRDLLGVPTSFLRDANRNSWSRKLDHLGMIKKGVDPSWTIETNLFSVDCHFTWWFLMDYFRPKTSHRRLTPTASQWDLRSDFSWTIAFSIFTFQNASRVQFMKTGWG